MPAFVPRQSANDKNVIREYLMTAIKHNDKIALICDPTLEQIYQQGGRPKSGSSNDPDDNYEEYKKYFPKQTDIASELLGQSLSDILKTPPRLLDWVFVRLCIDLKSLANSDKEYFEQYLWILDEGALKAAEEVDKLGKTYDLNPDLAFSPDFQELSPPEHGYFTAMLNKNVLYALAILLATIFEQWYPK